MTTSALQTDLDALAAQLGTRLSAPSVVRTREPLARRTTLRVGGPADLYVEPATEAELAATVRFAAEHRLPRFLLGRGSNLLVRDGGVRGLVVCLAQPEFSRLEVIGERLHAGAGARLKVLANEARRHGLAGFEFLEGIPGSLGGALRMNAGAMGGWTFEVVESVRFMDAQGAIHELPRAQLEVSYRCCPLLQDHIALSAVLGGRPDNPAAIETRMRGFSEKRWRTQPAAPSAGCIFKNPAAIPAGRLIDELGLKGTRVGGARISLEHGNFLVNDGDATGADILELIQVIKHRALAERGIELETEVEVVGEDAVCGAPEEGVRPA